MKLKQILTLGMSTLMLTSLLCACQAPAEDSESESQVETQAFETGKDIETEKPYASLEELIAGYLSKSGQSTETVWGPEIVPSSVAFQKDKPAVCLYLVGFSDQTVSDFMAERQRLDGVEMQSYQAENLLLEALVEKFKQEYIKDPVDFVAHPFDNVVVVYASAADLEYYASCNLVYAILPAKESLLPEGEASSRYFGQNLVPWEFGNYTYYYKRAQHSPSSPDQYPESAVAPILNEERFALKGVRPIALRMLDSTENLPYLKSFDDTNEWAELVASYDAEFFKTKVLFLLTFQESSGSKSHTIESINVSDNTFYTVVEQYSPEQGTADLANWIILIEADRAEINDCTVFDAWMNEN